jgi:hypothetical protein
MAVVDVLAVMDEEIASHRDNLPEFQPELDQMLAARAVVADLIEAAAEMNRLAKGPEGGVSMADKRAIVARMDAVLARIGGTP